MKVPQRRPPPLDISLVFYLPDIKDADFFLFFDFFIAPLLIFTYPRHEEVT